jgi:fermentation-respiration switch protein FrsA (DUF1100 family)
MAGGTYLCLLVVLMVFEERLVFTGPCYPAGGVWEGHGLPVEDVWFASEDGTRLHGWYIGRPDPAAVVLFCHGTGSTIAENPHFIRFLHNDARVAALLFDYRGYGRSEGSPTEAGILADARAARRWLAERAGIAEERIVLYGRSLGGAVAVDLAAEKSARGLVLESTFTSLPEVAARRFWYMPVEQVMRTRLASSDKIGRYRGPLLAYHSRGDEIVPFALGERLYSLSPSAAKQLFATDHRGHNDSPPGEYVDLLVRFFRELP